MQLICGVVINRSIVIEDFSRLSERDEETLLHVVINYVCLY